MRWLLPILLIGTVIFIGVKKLANAVSYKIKSIKLKAISLEYISFDVVLSIINPTNLPIEVKSIIADIEYKGSILATAKNTTTQTIVANAVTNITLQATAPTLSLAQNIFATILDLRDKKTNPVVSINGSIQLSTGSLTIATTNTLQLV